MKTPALHSKKPHRGWLVGTITLFLVLSAVSASNGRQVTVTITDLRGQMEIYGRSGSPGIGRKVKIGELLKVGDTIQTQDGTEATLTLPEGSMLHIGENTSIDLVALAVDPATGARQSQVKLLKGHMRATLSAGHQKEGSSFDIETPNALIGVTFSQPNVDVNYDPETKTTVVQAYTVGLNIRNLITKAEIKEMPKGHQAVIREEFILVTKITELSRLTDQLQRTMQAIETLAKPPETAGETKMDLLLETRNEAATRVPATSQLPAPGNRPEKPEREAEPVGFSLTVTEE